MLLEAGLVEKIDDGHYTISEKGRRYLTGDITTNELQIAEE